MDTILILDFGGQTCQLISRRIREIGVYSEIVSHDFKITEELPPSIKGFILSGSPSSVYEEGSPKPDMKIFETGLPVLGICYGVHCMMDMLGGKVGPLEKREYGRSKLTISGSSHLFSNVPRGFTSWMSHGDSIITAAPDFDIIGLSEHGIPAALENKKKKLYGIQFHPEVTHCEYGNKILENFSINICGAQKEWSMKAYIESVSLELRKKAGDKKVLLLISGGVDSTVTGGLLLKILSPEQVHLMYIDTGLMRKNESRDVAENLKRLGASHLHLIDASDKFLTALKNEGDPEKKASFNR